MHNPIHPGDEIMNLLLVDVPVDSYAMLIVNVGVVLLLGLVLGRLAERAHIPDISGYLVAGLLLGPITGWLNAEELSHMSILSNLALGFIAFQVGNELWWGKLKRTGRAIAIITVTQALFTTLVVSGILFFFTEPSIALILGAIAAATAPAPIMMLKNRFQTKGPLTDTIIPIVGLDDAVGVIVFGVMLSLGVALVNGEQLSPLQLLVEPLREIGLSVLIGSIVGLLSGIGIRTITSNAAAKVKHLDVILITVFLTVGMAMLWDASPILTPMIAGAWVTNLINKDTYVLEEQTIRFFLPPLMILFFTLSGAQLSFSVLGSIGLVGALYLVGRTIGKFGGCFLGANLVRTSPTVKKYLGIGMLPQSGVAIGLAMAAQHALIDVDPAMASRILNITLASVLVFALSGPVLVQWAFHQANEVTIKPQGTRDSLSRDSKS
jgi:Kef-type K+ transport system membrane component KefB